MLKSLHMKLVLILVLLITSVMVVIGTILINSVNNLNFNDFTKQVQSVLTPVFLETLKTTAKNSSVDKLFDVVNTNSGPLGINSYRNFYILDGQGAFLSGTNSDLGRALEKTPNLIAAMAGKTGNTVMSASAYMDYAVPVDLDTGRIIIYVKDTKESLHDLTWMLFAIIVQALFAALLLAIALSFVLTKTITGPIQNLINGAQRIGQGDFSYKLTVRSNDEIGKLTHTFNGMASVLGNALDVLDRERGKLETLFRHMTDGVVAFDQTEKLLHINLTAQEFLGETEKSFTFDDMASMLGLSVKFADVVALGEQNYLTLSASYKERRLKMNIAPFSAEKESESIVSGGIIVVMHDDTEQYNLEAARREFVANVSHELRTPLTTIKSYAETMLENDELPLDLRNRFLGVLVGESDRMTRIVKDLLVLSRLDNNKMEWQFESFNVRALLDHIFEAMLMEARGHRHRLEMSIDDEVGEMVGDKERIEQVVINLVSNAIKYTPDGGEIFLDAACEADRLVIRVTDNGIGIPEEAMERIFERFYRIDKARSREAGGTGLGLAIAKDIVEAHRGTIKITANPGSKGSRVTIALPLFQPEEENRSDAERLSP